MFLFMPVLEGTEEILVERFWGWITDGNFYQVALSPVFLVDGVELLDGTGGPYDEATEVTTRGELEEVEGIDRAGLDTSDVAESLDKILSIDLSAVDHEGSTALAVTAASHLTLTGAELLGSLSLLDIGTGTKSLKERKGSGGLGDAGDGGGVDNEGNLGDGGDLVTTGHQEGGDSGRSQSRRSSETPMILLDIFPKAWRLFKILTSGPG